MAQPASGRLVACQNMLIPSAATRRFVFRSILSVGPQRAGEECVGAGFVGGVVGTAVSDGGFEKRDPGDFHQQQ